MLWIISKHSSKYQHSAILVKETGYMAGFSRRRRNKTSREFNLRVTGSAEEDIRLRLFEQDGWCLRIWKFCQSLLVLVATLGVVCAVLTFSAKMVLLNANRLGRQRSDVKIHRDVSWGFSFAIVSCSDGLNTIPLRSFQGMMDLVSPNKISYANRHGYSFIDASDVLDKDRPPSWSKIKAVQKHLGSYDWIFWNDVDSLVTNFDVTLEEVLKWSLGDIELQNMPDLIITEDVTGVNAGMFFMRDTAWSRNLLELWWNQTSFIKPFGESKSGDNDALKFLLKNMPAEERKYHVCIPRMQSVFNSYLWIPSWKNVYRLVTLTRAVWKGAYSKGDFMLHFAGIDDKKPWIRRILQESHSDECSK